MEMNQKSKNPLLTALIVSVTFGFAAGAVGMLVAFAFALPEPIASGTVTPVRNSTLPAEDPAPAADIARSSVLFVDKAVAERANSDRLQSALPSDAFGMGFVLTSDGWLMSHAAAFPKGHLPLESYAVVGGRTYRVKQVVKDNFTNALFLRIDAAGLPIAAFGSSNDLTTGGSAFSFNKSGGIRRLDVAAFDDLAVATSAELRWSSERMQEVIHVSGTDGVLPGAMILSRKGEIVGLFAGNDSAGSYLVPREAFSRVIGGVLKEGVAVRPYLGIRYFDLTRVMGSGAVGRGALLVPSLDGKFLAVARKSPAEAAGLRAGDIVLTVNGQEVSAKVALSDLLTDYDAGDNVLLMVERDGTNFRMETTLGTATPQD